MKGSIRIERPQAMQLLVVIIIAEDCRLDLNLPASFAPVLI
jgi:hypothetical protein